MVFNTESQHIFNNLWAIYIQHVSFPLEAIGLLLVFIEVKYPEIADRIENTIDRTYDYLKSQNPLLYFQKN